jgi:hypothetical protein
MIQETITAPAPRTFKISVRVSRLLNRTTQVEIRDGRRYYGKVEDSSAQQLLRVEFIEFTEKGVKLDIPPRCCAKGHRVEFEIAFSTPRERIQFYAEGTIESAEAFANSHDCVSVRLTSHDADAWRAILRPTSSRR